MALAADGFTVAVSSGSDPAPQLWELRTGRRTATLDYHQRRLERFAFSPDGSLLVTGADDASAVVWTLDVRRVLQRLCANLAGPGLDAQWRALAAPNRLGALPCDG